MTFGRSTAAAGAALLVFAVVGCGGGSGSGEGGATELARWLPPGADFYRTTDFTAFEEVLGPPESDGPILGYLGDPATAFHVLVPIMVTGESGVVETGEEIKETSIKVPPTAILEAVQPEAVTSAAMSQSRSERLSVFATNADTEEIGSALSDLGYRDDGEVLVRGGKDPAIRLDDGLVFASSSADLLRSVPETPGEHPVELLDEIEGDDVIVLTGYECLREFAVGADADGAGRIAALADGDAKADLLEPQSALVDEPDAEGGLITAEVEAGKSGRSARFLQAQLLPGYECD